MLKGNKKALKTTLATLAVAALATAGLTGCSAGANVGGTLTYVTFQDAWTHADPNRNYTGRDIAWFGSYMHRTLTAYDRAEGAAGSAVVPDLATDTGTASNGNKTWEFTLRDGVAHIGASVGIAMYPLHGTTVDQLIEFADAALYFAKHAGRNVYRVFQVEDAGDASASA